MKAVAIDRVGNIYAAMVKRDLLLGAPYQGGIDGMLLKFSRDLVYQWGSNIVSAGKDDVPTVIEFTEGANGVQNPVVGGITNGDLTTRNAGGWDFIVMVY